MPENKNLTTLETARKILGPENFVSPEEALKIFPSRKADLPNYDLVPYSEETLYHCSDEKNPFVLFPGFQRFGNYSLSIYNLRDILKPPFDYFATWQEINLHKPLFIAATICESRWHLLSRKVVPMRDFHKLCNRYEWCYPDAVTEDRAVVYVCAWLLFKIGRQEEIFSEGPFRCRDEFSKIQKTTAYAEIKKNRIIIGQWRKYQRPGFKPDIVPSLRPETAI